MRDIYTIMWKEWKDTLFQGGRALIRPVLLIVVMGVVWPLLGKAQWLMMPPQEILMVLWVTLFVVISIVPDAFAGERERHTLETLLASRMPDSAILFGKVLIVVVYGWSIMVVSLFLGAGLSNLVYGPQQPAFYPTDLLLFTLAMGLLVNTLGASVGVLLSLRVPTVRQAQQTLMIVALLDCMLLAYALKRFQRAKLILT
jgi:ABC-2 type transport system permease protein